MTPEIEEILDRCIDAVRSGKDPEEILSEHPEAAGKIRHLLSVATELEELPDVQPSVEGMMKMMAKLAVERTRTKPAKARIGIFSRPVLVRAAAILLCVLFLGWGATSASSGALPGDMLYPLKRFTERVKFFLTVNAEGKAELRIVFSQERLKELIKKHRDKGGIDEELLGAMLAEAGKALEAGPDLSETSRELLISRVAYLCDLQKRALEQLKDRASPQELKELARYVRICDSRSSSMRLMMDRGDDSSSRKRLDLGRCPMCWQPNDGGGGCACGDEH